MRRRVKFQWFEFSLYTMPGPYLLLLRHLFFIMEICIAHYNTPELTAATVRSIRRFLPRARITIFDNSDRRPFPPSQDVRVIDNTRGQLVDFAAFLEQFPARETTTNGHGSVKHTMTVDKMWSFFPEGFILADSDILLTRDPSDLADPSVAWCGSVERRPPWQRRPARLKPFLCWLNVPLCRAAGIRYFDPLRTWRLRPHEHYDTGASFLEDCRRAGLPERCVDLREYIVHYGHGSWRGEGAEAWLDKYKHLHL